MTSATACPNCNAQLNPDDRFCAECGHPVSLAGVADSPASPQESPAVSPSPAVGADAQRSDPTPEPPISTHAARIARQRTALLETVRRAIAGRYQLLSELGRGGMAVVYLAHDPRLERRVAIKVMLPGLAMNEGMVERFELEARNAAALEHEHIVTIFSVEDAEDLAYFVMKYVDGVSLGDMLRVHGQLPVASLRDALAQVASALNFAHHARVVHRDVKPGNVMVDIRGHAVVTDFGISKGGSTNKDLTEVGAVVGTPPYMSPEQWRGDPATPASDQYALGIMMYELLTGSLPFRGNTMELSRQHLYERPRAITEERPDCPRELVELLDRLLAKNPADRFSNLEEAQLVLELPTGGEKRKAREELAALIAATRASSQAPLALPLPATPHSTAHNVAPPLEEDSVSILAHEQALTPTKILVREAPEPLIEQHLNDTREPVQQQLRTSIQNDATIVAPGEARVDEGALPQSARMDAAIAKPSDAESSLLAGAAVDRAPPTLDASALLEVARNETANSGSGSSDATRNLLPLTAETQHSATINPLLTASTSAPPSGHAPIAARNDSALSVVSGSLTKGRQLMVGGLVVAAALAAWFAFRPHAVAVVSTSSTGPTLPTKSDSLSLREDSTHVVTPPDSLQDTTRVAAADTSAVKASDTASVAPPAPPAPTTAPPPPPTPPPAVASRIALGDITSNPLVVGEHIRLRAQARSAAGARLPNAKLSWRAEPPGILRVSDRGELAAIAPGSATVVVASGKATLRKDFRVVPATLTSLKLFVYSPLKRGDSTTYRVTASDQRGHPFSTDGVRWSSNNDRVLSIDNRGVAHAKKKGVASIRATLGPLTTALDVRVDDPADALQSTSPASSPSSPTSSAIPAFPELEMRGKVQECLKALRTRDSERMRVLAGSPATDPSSPLEHLLSLMRPKDAKFQLLNTYFSDASRVSGTRATLDYGVRVGWLKLTGEEADSRLNFRALYEVKDNAWRFGWCAPQNGANLTR